MGSELDLDDVVAQSPLAQRQLKALRDGLALAREWLEGWGSAEPYIARIDALLEQGGAVAAREAHNLEVGGSNPSPASIEVDAARYRWLRSAEPCTANAELIPTLDLTALDDGIDAAMGVSGRNSGANACSVK